MPQYNHHFPLDFSYHYKKMNNEVLENSMQFQACVKNEGSMKSETDRFYHIQATKHISCFMEITHAWVAFLVDGLL
jgi:hypothetical protein